MIHPATTEMVAEAVKEFEGKSLAETRTAALKDVETMDQYIVETHGDDAKATVFGKGLTAAENVERHQKLDARIQAAEKRIGVLKAQERNKTRKAAIEMAGENWGNIPHDTSEAQRAAQEGGTRLVQSNGFATLLANRVFKKGAFPDSDVQCKSEVALRMKELDGALIEGVGANMLGLRQVGPQRLASGDAARGNADPPLGPALDEGGAPFFRPRDESRVVEKIIGQQYQELLPLLPSEEFGRDAYKYMAEDTNDFAVAEGREGKDGQAANLIEFHESEKTVIMTEIRVATRMTYNIIRFMPGFWNRAQTRLVRYMRRRVETQLLQGDGAGNNIQGMLQNAPDTAMTAAGTIPSGDREFGSDYIIRERGAIMKAGGMMNLVVIHVDDFYNMLTARTRYDLRDATPDMLGSALLPTNVDWVVTDKIPAGTVLCADRNECIVPFAPNVMVETTQDGRSQDREKGIWTMVVCGNYQLAILRDACFQKVTSFAGVRVSTA